MAKNEVRIIGGNWRGRKLKFPDAQGLRPSLDRSRETLFNWVAPWIEGARILDLFAGSGALGFESLSRGAASAELIDLSKPVVKALEANKAMLKADNARIVQGDAIKHLYASSTPFDLVFLDPPFNSQLVRPALDALTEQKLLAEGALIYAELSRHAPIDWEYERLRVYRDKSFGDSRALLMEHA